MSERIYVTNATSTHYDRISFNSGTLMHIGLVFPYMPIFYNKWINKGTLRPLEGRRAARARATQG